MLTDILSLPKYVRMVATQLGIDARKPEIPVSGGTVQLTGDIMGLQPVGWNSNKTGRKSMEERERVKLMEEISYRLRIQGPDRQVIGGD